MWNKIATGALLLFLGASVVGCKDDAIPKPNAYLRLDYPIAGYEPYNDNCAFGFYKNRLSLVRSNDSCQVTLNYPQMKATVYLSYKPVRGNLTTLLRDAQKLTYGHVIKASDIYEQPYINPETDVYGMFYSVGGNAATNSQFYVTDSTRHFVTGSLYFYAKPNFDSIMPAADYIKNDLQTLMETLYWK